MKVSTVSPTHRVVNRPISTPFILNVVTMLCPPQHRCRVVEHWLDRHQSVMSFALHMVGIPVSLLGLLLLPISIPAGSLAIFILSFALFVGGYAFQFLGHALEGSDPGEIVLIKRKLGRPYVEFAPGRQPRHRMV